MLARVSFSSPLTSSDQTALRSFQRRNRGVRAVVAMDHQEFAAGLVEITFPGGDGTLDYIAVRTDDGVQLDDLRRETEERFADFGAALNAVASAHAARCARPRKWHRNRRMALREGWIGWTPAAVVGGLAGGTW